MLMKITSDVQNFSVRSSLPVRASAERVEGAETQNPVSFSPESLSISEEIVDAKALHAKIYGTPALADRISYSFFKLGYEGFLQKAPPETYTADEAERFNKVVSYLANLLERRELEVDPSNNPFWGMGRDALVAIEQDEKNYTEEERCAALRAKAHLDNDYFTRLIEHAVSSGDDRPLFKGYLEYLDHLTPAERLNYPANEREKVASQLATAEAEKGSLPEDFSLWKYINWDPKGRLNLEALLDPSSAEPTPVIEAGSADDQGSSRLR
jgi:hypothetical protein